MVISNSSSYPRLWVGTAFLFSGRPDPVWEVPPDIVAALEKIWESLVPWAGPLPEPPALGYRGCLLRDNGHREYFAFGGAVTLRILPTDLTRKDGERKFERLLLSSSPPGIIPPAVFEMW